MAVINLTNENFDKEVNTGTVIIDFWASWCGPCQMLAPVFEELSSEYDNLKFAKCSTEESPEKASHFQVMSIPCLVIAKDGKEVDRIVGFMPKDQLKKKIDEILEKI